MMYLSKSDFILGNYCQKALWLKKHKRELLADTSDSWTSSGYDVQDLAQKLYPDGVEIEAEPWEVDKGAELTQQLSKKHKVLFEAVARLDNGAFCRIDILEKAVRGWNLIEIKSTKDVTDTQLSDLAYQYYVFKNAGYTISHCYVLHLSKGYIRKKRLNIKQLFVCEDVTAEVKSRYNDVAKYAESLLKYQNKRSEPKVNISKSCQGCDFYDYCCRDVPEYSIWDIFNATTAEEKILFKGLEDYCFQDTYAMVLLMKVLYEKAK